MSDRHIDFAMLAVFTLCLWAAFWMGAQWQDKGKTIRIRSACDVERIEHLKANYFTEVP